jgi:hypothetical protein
MWVMWTLGDLSANKARLWREKERGSSKMNSLQKPKRYENEEYLEFIRKQPCCVEHVGCRPVSSKKRSDPHHVKSKKSGGSDLESVPMCRFIHGDIHNIGVITFQTKYQVDLRDVQIDCLQKFVEEEMP